MAKMMMVALALMVAVASADVMVYLGAGGCDVADTQCVPPSDAELNQIEVYRAKRGPKPSLEFVGNITNGLAIWITTYNTPTMKCMFATQTVANKISAFSVGPDGMPIKVNEQDVGGFLNPVHTSVATSKHGQGILLVANYHGPDDTADQVGAGVSSMMIGEDCALTLADTVPHAGHSINPDRQSAAHVHSFYADVERDGTLYAFAADLGQDLVFTYSVGLTDGNLTEVARTKLKAGAGPRHMAVDSKNRVLYVLAEMDNFLNSYTIDDDGSLTLLASASTLSADEGDDSKAAEPLLYRDSENNISLYASNRGYGKGSNSIAQFKAASDGSALARTTSVSAEGSFPRGFEYTCDKKDDCLWFIAGQGSGNLAVFTGPELTYTGVEVEGLPTPVTIGLLEM